MRKYFSFIIFALLIGTGAFYINNATSTDLGLSAAMADSHDDVVPAQDIILGDPEAPISIIEYASFTCPHCARFHTETFKKLKENYIDTNRASFALREVYFDRFGLWAGLLGRCGGDMRYYGMVDLIFNTQKDWLGSGASSEILENLKTLGRTSGLSNDEIDQCMQDEDRARSLVAAYQKNAKSDKITGTPTFVINGTTYSNMNYQDFAEVLDALLDQ